MEGQAFPNNMTKDGEKFTTEEWKYLTRKWQLTDKYLAVLARKRSLEERCKIISKVSPKFQKTWFEHQESNEELMAAIWSLSDEALDRLIASFDEEDKQRFAQSETVAILGEEGFSDYI